MFVYFTSIAFPEWDTEWFVFINKMHATWLDPIMELFSSYACWVVICAIVIVAMLHYKHKKMGRISALFLVSSIATNGLINNILKVIIARPRPSQEQSLNEIIHLLESTGISYSFFSAHSSSSFCLAVFSALFFRKKWYTITILAWALLVSYSRIYVGKHYPIDVITGILFGSLLGFLGFRLFTRYQKKRLSDQANNLPV
ncbi:phosphatase PAP2 family protein [Odoribacter sp. OttesenSCG-928-J03]|nr:phosphatase PAP2 family protein [Odoribacter sp. OttesenSCG-928-J03]MDL2283318.1 phosphatase PAP2 family protein [Odoribacter sp. OttesenSCG-928-G04]